VAPIPSRRATVPEPSSIARPGTGTPSAVRTSLPGNPLAPAAARGFVRTALAHWAALGVLGPCAVCGGADAPAGRRCPPDRHSADLLADDAALIVDELVTNAVVHAGTDVEIRCRVQDGDPAARPDGFDAEDATCPSLVVEVTDRHPARVVLGEQVLTHGQRTRGAAESGHGLRIVSSLARTWGITYRTGLKTVWAHLALDGRAPVVRPPAALAPALRPQSAAPGTSRHGGSAGADETARRPDEHGTARRGARDDAEWGGHGAMSFLAEASDLLAGQLDEDVVAGLAAQLLVPRLADWCAIWLDGAGGAPGGSGPLAQAGGQRTAPRLAQVRHADESRAERLRTVLEASPPTLLSASWEAPHTGPVPVPVPVAVPWRRSCGAEGCDGSHTGVAVLFRLVTNGRPVGTLLLGRSGQTSVPEAVTTIVGDFARRVALAIGAARRYTREATISQVLQRGLLPSRIARIPGVEGALVYEPSDEGLAGGDFYDVFHCSGDRWCFMLGDVQGSGPEAAVVTGLARPWLRLLGREGHSVGEVLDRLNRLLLDDATEAAEAASLLAAAGAAAGLPAPAPAEPWAVDGHQPRFLSLVYGELVPRSGGLGGARCTLASAGHPLPLLLRPDGTVRQAAEPQLLLGVFENTAYRSSTFDLEPGDTLLCVTDGVTERRSGALMLDDGDGLARVLAGCAGLTAEEISKRIRSAVHGFDTAPPSDDLALLVFRAE
jgi:serine phosphatase RsbU (regulator of sigma subunit)/anti-sigma regulatory factor (Ser/Thr protein kinase)